MGRNSDAREKLLETATRLIHERGYNAVGINELCAEAGVKKGSFYHFFDSKVALVEAVLEGHLETLRGFAADRPESSPLEQLSGFAGDVARTYLIADDGETRLLGCPVGNLAAEMSTQEEPIRQGVARCYREVTGLLGGFVDRAVAAGQLPPCHDTSAKAMELLTFMQGAALVSKALAQPELVTRALQSLPSMLGAPTPPPVPVPAPGH